MRTGNGVGDSIVSRKNALLFNMKKSGLLVRSLPEVENLLLVHCTVFFKVDLQIVKFCTTFVRQVLPLTDGES